MRTLIILPYFGTFNCYFKLWLDSCGNNQDFEWMILTDAVIGEDVPRNVRVVQTTLVELKERFQKKMGISLSLETAYKLCDYKQFYGYLFSEELAGYDYWGYCDCDLIFGDIRNFLTEETQIHYDKVLRTGHFSVVRNDKTLNELFFKYMTYKITLTSPIIYGYDESITGYHLGFAGELLDSGYSFLDCAEWIADIDFRYYPFYEMSNHENPCVFLFENGHIFRIDKNGNTITKQERMYVHLQKRKMKVEKGIDNERYLICPNKFCCYSDELLMSNEFWEQVRTEKDGYFNFSLEQRENVIRDIKRFMHEPRKLNSVLYRLRGK